MQRSKLPGSRLWIAGVSTVAILLGCEAQPVKDQAANGNQPSAQEEAKFSASGQKEEAIAAGGITPQAAATPEFDRMAGAAGTQPLQEPPAYGIAPASPADGAFMQGNAALGQRIVQPAPGEGENYLVVNDGPVKQVAQAPVSTFSIDVDTGGYSNVRRFLMNGQMPPKDAVRVEEMINYFSYDYPAPEAGGDPFRVTTSVVRTPWNPETHLLHVGIKGYAPPAAERPAANLVFLVDVSGSMDQPDKLPLLRAGMKILTDQLRDDDKVTIVVYAGAAGLVLEPTFGKDKAKIKAALDRLQAGGSTAGGE